MNDIILAGFGGHAKGVIDSIEKSGLFHITGYTDPEFRGEYRGYKKSASGYRLLLIRPPYWQRM